MIPIGGCTISNSVSVFYQTVVSALGEATKLLKPTWMAHDSIFWDFKPDEVGVLGQTINAGIPVDPTNSVNDIGSGDVILSDIAFTTTPIVYNRHPQFGYPVRDFEQFNSPDMIRNVFLDAAMTGIRNNVNAQVAALFNSTNFITNTAVSCTSGVVTVPQFLGGMALLADQRVPVHNSVENMTFIVPSKPYTLMQDGTTGGAGAAWTQAFIVGEQTAKTIHDTGTIPVAFATQFKLDQQMPTTGTVGSRTFTGALLHRYAIAGVSRALPKPDERVVECTYVDWGKLSLRVMLGYNQYPKGGYIITIDAGYGLKVVRENMGVLFSIAE